MALTPAICTQCGAQIQVDGSKEAGICPNCGTAFITEKVINKFVTNNNFAGATFNVQGGPTVDNLYILADRAYEEKKYDDADSYYKRILEQSPNEWKAYYRHGVYDGRLLGVHSDKKYELTNNAFTLMVTTEPYPAAETFISWFWEIAGDMYGYEAWKFMYKIFDYINGNYSINKKETILSVAEHFGKLEYWHIFTENLYKKLVELNTDGYLDDVIKNCVEMIYKETRDYTPDWENKARNPQKTGYDEWEKAYLEYFPERKDEVEKNFNDRCTRWKKYRTSKLSAKFWGTFFGMLFTVVGLCVVFVWFRSCGIF